MNWKKELQLNDIDPEQALEFTCKKCAATYLLPAKELQKHYELRFLWLDEIERQSCCKQRDCHGSIRLAILHNSSNSGFVAGLA